MSKVKSFELYERPQAEVAALLEGGAVKVHGARVSLYTEVDAAGQRSVALDVDILNRAGMTDRDRAESRWLGEQLAVLFKPFLAQPVPDSLRPILTQAPEGYRFTVCQVTAYLSLTDSGMGFLTMQNHVGPICGYAPQLLELAEHVLFWVGYRQQVRRQESGCL
ncbi:MAG: hypothetical protein PHV57_07160 [Methanomicrobiaceae archaeon]|nr:hypothetical protein [Methanomicrobiaceae archaeon]